MTAIPVAALIGHAGFETAVLARPVAALAGILVEENAGCHFTEPQNGISEQLFDVEKQDAPSNVVYAGWSGRR
jgi:hypothetical protein